MIDPARYDRAVALLRRWADAGKVTAAGLVVGCGDTVLPPVLVGKMRPGPDAPPVRDDTLFLVASITKPVTVTAAMILAERGELLLDERVSRVLPRFAGNGKDNVRVRHLMTHTSGLPDMIPENEAYRKAHRPFADFVSRICELPLAFEPGTRVSYSSAGTAIVAELVHQISGVSLPEFLQREVFGPLGMKDTSLGWRPATKDRVAAVRTPDPALQNADWSWNSPYWLGFGAPWGGLVTSPADLAVLCRTFLGGGALGGVRVLSPATVRAMTTNQLVAMPGVPEEDRRCRPWGLGWRLNWPGHSANFGDLLGPRSYGHWGATGTVCWLDPDTKASMVLLTTEPQETEGRFLARLSNAVAAAVV